MSRKRLNITAIVLTLCLVLGQFVPITANATTNEPTISISNAQGYAGETVDVDVIMENNPGLIAAVLTVEYDSEVMTLTDVTDGGILGAQVHTDVYESPYLLSWMNFTATSDYTNSGVIATLTFKLSEDVKADQVCDVKISYSKENDDILNYDGDVVDFATVDGSVTIKAPGEPEESVSEQLVGYTISLKGDIAVNVHMRLSEEISRDESAYIKFTFADGGFVCVPVSQAKIEDNNYIFTFNIQAPKMNDKFVTQVITNVCETEMYTYSVKEYADYILEHTEENTEYAKASAMVRAMLNYGGYAQLQFGYDLDALANKGLYNADEDPVLTENITLDDKYSFVAPNADIGLQYYGSSLLLNAKTTIRHYFTITGNEDIATIRKNYEFILDDNTILTPSMRDGKVYVDIKGINAAELDNMFNLVVKTVNTEEKIFIEYSPLSYAKYVLENSFSGTKLMNVIKAMCLYNEAANDYLR